MKLLLDENLSPRLVEALGDLYAGSQHVHALGLGGADDGEVWSFAKAHGFAIVTKDSDFAERGVLESEAPKVVWIRLGNCSTDEIERVLRSQFEAIRGFLEEDEEICLVLERNRNVPHSSQ